MQISLLDERRSEIGHDEISHEHYPFVRQLDEHRITRFSSLHRDKPDARSADVQLCGMVNGDIRLEAAYVIQVEALAEKGFGEYTGSIEFDLKFFVVIAPGIEAQARIQGAEIRVSANVVPMRVRNEDGRQFGQARRMRSKSFVGAFGGVRPRAGASTERAG